MKVLNYKKYTCCEYINERCSLDGLELGDVVIRYSDDVEIGIVIQIHKDGIRTDMFGNEDTDKVEIATFDQIKLYRPEIVPHLNVLQRTIYIAVLMDERFDKKPLSHFKSIRTDQLYFGDIDNKDILAEITRYMRDKYDVRATAYDVEDVLDMLNDDYEDTIYLDDYYFYLTTIYVGEA